jgi:uncharacterized protein with GYD domain
LPKILLSFRPTIPTNKEALTAKETNIMAFYMVQAAYTAEAWATMVKNPQDRSKPFSELAQKLGARLIDAYYCFGEYDVVVIFEAPEDTTASAAVLAVISPGHLKTTKTTKLFTIQETMEMMRKAGNVTYQAPSKE